MFDDEGIEEKDKVFDAGDSVETELDFGSGPQTPSGPVTCLGMTFEHDETRRAHFTEELRKKLQDPEFRKIEGFPIGSDEDILNLSDPPYYTACPNPWISDFIAEWEAQKPKQPEGYHYHREPFAADVSEGKNDPIYNAHSYHTKVPHKAIMRYILHYTEPGDIVFDGFCGTGMTGVAAQMCGDLDMVKSLGYQVKQNGAVLQEETDENGRKVWTEFSVFGKRNAVLNDLSPLASFVASNYNSLSSFEDHIYEIEKLFKSTRKDLEHLYKTQDPETGKFGIADFFIWSEVFTCPECSHEESLFELAVDKSTYKLVDKFPCPSCNADLSKDKLERVWTTTLLPTGEIINESKCDLVEVSCKFSGKQKRYCPTSFDLKKLEESKGLVSHWYPADEFPHGRQTRKVKTGSGISYVFQMFTPRALHLFSHFWNRASQNSVIRKEFRYLLSSIMTLVSRRERFRDGTGKGAQSGTLYVPSLQVEKNFFDVLERKLTAIKRLARSTKKQQSIIECQSNDGLKTIPKNSIDYIFTDPPFGESLQYAELNFFNESWFRVGTKIERDCVLNYVHGKDLSFYKDLMKGAFAEAYRVLKPSKWITVEFHNSQNSVWMAIQEALWQAGFTVADVRVLDKQQGTYNVVNRSGSVNKDLVISAYKPDFHTETSVKIHAGSEESVWDFVRMHLGQLPAFVSSKGATEIIPERQPHLLFDRMVAFHVQRGISVPISAAEFYQGLSNRYPERDGMFFLEEQVAIYDRNKMYTKGIEQLSLFVVDEASAIQWLRRLLKERTQTFQDINPQFLKEIGGWNKNEEPLELSTLLEQNFLRYDGKGPVPEQIHAYLSTNWKELRNLPKDDPALVNKARDRWYVPDPNKAGDLEKLREKALLKEFEEYKEVKKKLKVFRLEAVRAGFKKAWQERDYAVIVAVADKIPNNVLEEDPKLLMWYDQAVTRMGGE
jgi:DNA modification methylase